MKYALNLAEDGRVLSVTYPEYAPFESIKVSEIPDGNVSDYIYEDGNFIYDPLPKIEIKEIPTWQDRIEAQVTYTAIITDSLLPVEKEEI